MRPLPSLKIILKPRIVHGIKASWNFYNDIPPLNIIASPRDKNWKERVKEEKRVFSVWIRFNPSAPFRNLRLSNTNPRKFLIDVNLGELFKLKRDKWRTVTILIPLNYPRQYPTIGDPSTDGEFLSMLREWTGYKPFCMPPIFRAWWYSFKGKAGIAHFLQAFSFFLSIAGRKTSKQLRL